MNAVSGIGSFSPVQSVVTNAPVKPVRTVLGNADRVPAPVDRYVPSMGKTGPSVTYARNGSGGHGDADGDGS